VQFVGPSAFYLWLLQPAKQFDFDMHALFLSYFVKSERTFNLNQLSYTPAYITTKYISTGGDLKGYPPPLKISKGDLPKNFKGHFD
jgi:hypothetical protein